MSVIYIAGPFRGPHAWAIEQNVRRAEAVAYEVFACGHVALCPHTNTRFFDGALPDQIFIDGTLELMRRCDAVLVLQGSEKSAGTQGEIAEAKRLGMPVVQLNYPFGWDVLCACRDIELALKNNNEQQEQKHGTTKEG